MKKYQNCRNFDSSAYSCYKGRDCEICLYYSPIDIGIFIDKKEDEK